MKMLKSMVWSVLAGISLATPALAEAALAWNGDEGCALDKPVRGSTTCEKSRSCGGGSSVRIRQVQIDIDPGNGDSSNCCRTLLIIPDHEEKVFPGPYILERNEPPLTGIIYVGNCYAKRLLWLIPLGYECRYENPLRIGRYDTYERVRLCEDDDELDQIDVD